MLRREALIAGETYHIYNRGAHKREIFSHNSDYERFLSLLYISNNSEPTRLANLQQGPSLLESALKQKTDGGLVDVFAYCLMSNHFHLVLRQKADAGVTTFMRKLATGYSMYFNTKYEHSGVLFQGRFKSSHIDNEPYFRYIFSYVHLNPLEIVAPGWKDGVVPDPDAARKFLADYRYASFRDYCVGERPERRILAYGKAPDFLKQQNDLEDTLREYAEGRMLHDKASTDA